MLQGCRRSSLQGSLVAGIFVSMHDDRLATVSRLSLLILASVSPLLQKSHPLPLPQRSDHVVNSFYTAQTHRNGQTFRRTERVMTGSAFSLLRRGSIPWDGG